MKTQKEIRDLLNKEKSKLRDLTHRKMDKTLRKDDIEIQKIKVNSLEKELQNTDSCINCRYLRPIMKHPKNKGVGRGSIIDRMGWVCILPDDAGTNTYFFEDQYGLCEMFVKK